MAFQQTQNLIRPSTNSLLVPVESSSQIVAAPRARVEESQEWILFSPSQAESSTNRTQITQTAGLSRVSDLGSLNTAARSGRLESNVLEEEATEDGELDSLDEGLHAFREPIYQTNSNQSGGAVLPAHDGLGLFAASSGQVQDQLWQHEHFNPKRKYEGHHRRPSSVQRRLDTIDEFEAQSNEDKRMRIEKWRTEQSQALLEEVERETRRKLKRESSRHKMSSTQATEDLLSTTPKQGHYLKGDDEDYEHEPFWRRITRKFIRDVIGIDEPLLSVILGESLPEEVTERQPSTSNTLPTIRETVQEGALDLVTSDLSWRDRLLQRIARELGVFVHQISPHPGAFTTYSSASNQYAGMPIVREAPSNEPASSASAQISQQNFPQASVDIPKFLPTVQETRHAASWGLEEEAATASASSQLDDKLRQEREYWERELDIKRVVRFLKGRFVNGSAPPYEQPEGAHPYDAARRAAVIRQNHPLVARAHRSPARLRRESRLHARRPSSSCASESVKSSRKASLVRSGSSSRNYWDIGGSVGSGSILASGGLMGGWGEV